MSYIFNTYNFEITKEDIEKYKSEIGLKTINERQTILMYYLYYNNYPSIEIVKLLKKEKNITDYNYITPLMYYFMYRTIENINPEIIKYFSNQICKKNVWKKTALIYYLEYNINPKLNIINLLKKGKNIFSEVNETPLMFYCQNKNIENLNSRIIKYFSKQIILKNTFNENALMFYLRNNKNPSIDIIKLLDKEKNIVSYKNNTLLMYYCKNTKIYKLDPKIINYFSNQIGKQNNEKHTALIYYLIYNKNPKLESIKLLKDEIKIYYKKNKTTILMLYIKHITENLTKKDIIEYFENQIGLENKKGKTALMLYLKNNENPSIDIIKLLDKEKAINNKNNTLLMCYCKNKYIEQANPNIINLFKDDIGKTINFKTALIYYLRKNKKPSIDIIRLLDKEKNIYDYNTPLRCYSKNKNIEILDPEIIEYFSNQIGLKNKYNKTALLYYLENKYNKDNVKNIKYLYKEVGYINFKYYNIEIDLDIY